MDTLNLIKKRRSIRKFKQELIKKEDLLALIEAASFAHSVCNRQALRYYIITDPEKVKLIFENSSMGMVSRGEEGFTLYENSPTCYIIFTTFGTPSHLDFADAGASFQNMGLLSSELNLGLFWLHAFANELLHDKLEIDLNYSILTIIAVGKPNENPVAVAIEPTEREKYNYPTDKNNKIPKLKTKHLINWRQ